MRRDLRPQSARCKPAINKPTPLSDDIPFLHTVSKQFGIASPLPKPSPHIHPSNTKEHQPLATSTSKQQQRMSSSSKLLRKFHDIRAYRSTKNNFEEDPIFQEKVAADRLKANEERPRSYRKASEEIVYVVEDYPGFRPTTAFNNNLARKNRLDKASRPHSGQQYVQMPRIFQEDLLFQKAGLSNPDNQRQLTLPEGIPKPQQDSSLTAYWKSENKFVSLFLLEKNENLNYQHEHILPIYAEVQIQGLRYVVSDEYKNCSLSHLIQQFGPFPEALARRYLKQIALGVQHLHFHKKSHNQLNAKTILYNKQGNLFINMMKAASIHRKKEDLTNNSTLYWHSPEFLSPKKSKTFKNDIWALGCLAIQMLTPGPLSESPLHPYNFLEYQSIREQTMIDNLKQRYPSSFLNKKDSSRQNNQKSTLSPSAERFIRACLEILDERRPEMETLLQHQFLQRS